jgi:hypothetical protein
MSDLAVAFLLFGFSLISIAVLDWMGLNTRGGPHSPSARKFTARVGLLLIAIAIVVMMRLSL